VLGEIACLFMNTREAASLCGEPQEAGPAALAARLSDMGLKSGVITLGSAAVTGFDAQGIFQILPPKPQSVADATGAGDARAGVTAAAMMRGEPFRQALREGIAAAVLTVESPAAVAKISERALKEMLMLVPEAGAVA